MVEILVYFEHPRTSFFEEPPPPAHDLSCNIKRYSDVFFKTYNLVKIFLKGTVLIFKFNLAIYLTSGE